MPNPSNACSRAVWNLQIMLRTIATAQHENAKLIPDGIYGSETASAITSFQRSHGLPATGVTDQLTWDCIVQQYNSAVVEVLPAEPISVDLPCGGCFCEGDSSPFLMLAQCMLSDLSIHYCSISAPKICGNHEASTVNAVSQFQNLCGISASGKLDKTTWKYLVLHYPAICSKN